MKLFIILVVLFTCYGQLQTAESVCGLDWLPYKDEKCFRVIDDTLRTFDDAQKACSVLENEPSLVIVRTKEEQDFLSNYLFKTLKKEDNFWIGAKYSVNGSHFKWMDNTDLAYTNWDETRKGTTNKENHCIQIQADERVVGQWIDEPCGKSNKVVCQKLQTWSMARLQKEFLDERKQHRDALENANNNFKHDLETANNNFKKEIESSHQNLKLQLDEANKKIASLQQSSDQKVAELKQSLIPIGFLYTQLPKEKQPSEIWPWMKWEDVSSAYSGVFFRVQGGGSATFGQEQPENAPHITSIVNGICENLHVVSTVIGGRSSPIYSGDGGGSGHICLAYEMSGGEVRPRNIAIRVWRRTG